jgi:signal transduction histidine kinase
MSFSAETGAIPKFYARASSGETVYVAYEEISSRRPGRRLRSRVSLARDDSGKIVAYILVARDITETVAREREINCRQQTARFGRLAAILVHEIKPPLQAFRARLTF